VSAPDPRCLHRIVCQAAARTRDKARPAIGCPWNAVSVSVATSNPCQVRNVAGGDLYHRLRVRLGPECVPGQLENLALLGSTARHPAREMTEPVSRASRPTRVGGSPPCWSGATDSQSGGVACAIADRGTAAAAAWHRHGRGKAEPGVLVAFVKVQDGGARSARKMALNDDGTAPAAYVTAVTETRHRMAADQPPKRRERVPT
jgi:hypothetical protein